MKSVKIVIPIYKPTLTELESQLLRHNLETLHRHRIVILIPEGMDRSWLNEQFDVDSRYEVIEVSDEWLGRKNGIAGYNEMMLSTDFYKLFEGVDYILICQTDVYIFKDELLDWCERGYDYIAAPWSRRPVYDLPILKQYMQLRLYLNNPERGFLRQQLFGRVGNGGLSLRRVDSFIAASVKYRDEITRRRSGKNNHLTNEDTLWALLPQEFRYPEYNEALRFSIDVKPELCLKINGGELPFGCHGVTRPKIFKFWQDKLDL